MAPKNKWQHPTLKQQRAERAALIAELGWPAEPVPCPRGEEYAATTGELRRWVLEQRAAAKAVA